MKKKFTVIVGIAAGIAAYKIVELIKLLQEKELEVQVIMTHHAAQLISPKEFEKISGHKVYITLFPEGFDYRKVLNKREVDHIKLADSASVFAVAPATANIIGKIAHGIADDFLTTTLLATAAEVLICPSMNPHMWGNPLVQENIKKLEQLGYHFLTPDTGNLACGYQGIGRLPDIKMIAAEILQIMKQKNKLKGRKIIVTAGGTIEEIDKVRVITNKASGKMGRALAEECYLRGADVLLLRSVTAVDVRERQDTSGGGGIRIETFKTGQDLSALMRKYICDYDTIFHTAAVSDFKTDKPIEGKLDSLSPTIIKFVPTVKILNQIKIWNPKIKLVGFKAVYKETEKNLIKKGLDKLKESRSDYIIANDVGREGVGFGVNTNEVYIISPNGSVKKIDKASKTEIARKILEYIFKQ